ncbi:DNA polymerase delta subunit 4-like isoform X2 [Corticium candelabrum]|uniref:DNA polymerase delta subunit 4-like isoform X2 n=1 Tax=Corticium candelabrum TaxID=121492 RepID=UPI002E270EED|nr:DNA polymerase delta subunit 4-like isoform X2 [Corticium candelabrum]
MHLCKAAHAKQLLREYMETNHVIGVSRMATQQQLSFKAVKKGDSNRKHSKTAVIPVQTRSYKGSTPELDDKEIQHKLNILKEFDHTVEFGPSIGITRLERWERAEAFNLNPPAEVRDIILMHGDDRKFAECLWDAYNI